MKRINKLLILLLSLSLLFSFIGCDSDPDNDDGELYYSYAELAFDPPAKYTKLESDVFDALFTDDSAVIGISRFSFDAAVNDDLDASMFPRDVAKKYAEKNALDVELISRGAYCYFTYSDSDYFNHISFFRSKYAHFIVKFMCIEEEAEAYGSEFINCSDSVYFTL